SSVGADRDRLCDQSRRRGADDESGRAAKPGLANRLGDHRVPEGTRPGSCRHVDWNRPVKRVVLVGAALLVACTWSNSLYQARLLSNNALRAEREKQPGQAQRLWGQVIAPAESAYA